MSMYVDNSGLPLFKPKATEPKPGTQCYAVLKFIRDNGSISDVEAFTGLRIRRLAARIYDLAKMGWTFRTEDERHEGGSHARYYLEG